MLFIMLKSGSTKIIEIHYRHRSENNPRHSPTPGYIASNRNSLLEWGYSKSIWQVAALSDLSSVLDPR